MTIESQSDIDGIMAAGRVVAMVRDSMLEAVEPGMTTQELDAIGGACLKLLEHSLLPGSYTTFLEQPA